MEENYALSSNQCGEIIFLMAYNPMPHRSQKCIVRICIFSVFLVPRKSVGIKLSQFLIHILKLTNLGEQLGSLSCILYLL